MEDSDGEPMFAFQDLDYIPFGYSGILAPYIETGPGTMRAASTLMALDLALKDQKAAATVVCDLGCGDGEFRKIARQHIHLLLASPLLLFSSQTLTSQVPPPLTGTEGVKISDAN